MKNNTIHRIVRFLRISAGVSVLLLFTGTGADAGTPEDTTAVRQPFWSNTFFKAAGGANLHFSNTGTSSPGCDFTLAFGKNFGHYSSLRLSGTIETYSYGNKSWIGELNLLYGLNVHNFFKGENHNRIFELSPFAGIGFDIGRSESVWGTYANVQAGMELGFRLYQNLYLTLEPVGKYYVHALAGQHSTTEFSAGITAGLRYKVNNLSRLSAYQRDRHLMAEEDSFMNLAFLDNTFYRLGVGVNLPKSTKENSYRTGPSFEFAAGKKISGLHSVILELAAEKELNKSRKYNVNALELNAIYGLDITSALYGYKYDRTLTFSALMGAGVDFIDINDKWNTNANIQAGADFDIRVTDFLSFYINPMARIFLMDDKERVPGSRMSVALNATAGLQYTVSHNEYIKSGGRSVPDSKEDMIRLTSRNRQFGESTNSFIDNTFVMFLSGINRRDATKREYKSGSNIGLEFGKELNRYHSLSIGLDYEHFKCNTTSKPVNIYELDFIHSMNLTNLSHSETYSRKFFLKTVGGLGLNQNHYDSHIGLSAVAMVGIQTDFVFTPGFSLVLRPLAKGYYGKVTDDNTENTFGFSAQFSAGLRLNFINRHVRYVRKNKTDDISEPEHDGITKYGFNALEFALQNAGNNDRYQFTRKYKYDGAFIHAGYTMENVAYDADAYDWTKCITAGAGMRFWKNHTMLADVTIGNIKSKLQDISSSSDGINVGYYELEAMHMYHITSVIHGFNPERIFELSTIEGIGMNALNDDSRWSIAGNIKLGLDFKIRLSNTLSFYLDPCFKVHTAGITSGLASRYQTDSDWRNYHFSYGATAGLFINLTSRDNK